jgi:integrase
VLEDAARLSGNPWDKITPRQLTALATRKRALTPAQFDALLAATETDVDLHDLFTLLAWTGQRLVDGVTLRWGTVDFSRGIITLAPQKTARRTGKQVHIPLFPAVRALLDRRQAGSILDPSAFVFPAIVEEYERDGGATLSKRIGAAFTLAGMETTEERADRARGVTVYGAHSLRHHFVTAAASAGMPSAMIKSITGHATDAMQEHYVQIGADLAREIAARMTAKALPVVGGCPAMEPIAPALKGKLEALRAIANRIGPDTWPGCKAELFGVLDAINK